MVRTFISDLDQRRLTPNEFFSSLNQWALDFEVSEGGELGAPPPLIPYIRETMNVSWRAYVYLKNEARR